MLSAPLVPLPRAAASEVGIDARGILALIDALESAPQQDPHALAVMRDGRVVASGAWAPYAVDRPALSYSLSKSFTAAAAGTLVDEGVLDLDAPVVDFFPEFADEITDARTRRILVRHALSMSTGHTRDMVLDAWMRDPAEPVRGFLLQAPDAEPGTVFAYNQPATYTAAAIVQRLAGRSLTELLAERVLGPIGAGPVAWQQWPAGRDLGFSGGFFTIDHALRLGELLRRRGSWQTPEGETIRVLSESWVDAATSRHIATVPAGEPEVGDWAHGYGFQQWMMPDGFRGDGAYGQYTLVFPALDLVVAYQGQTVEMQQTIDLVREHLLPAIASTPGPSADAALAERLSSLALPLLVVPSAAVPRGADWDGRRFEVAGGAVRAREHAARDVLQARPAVTPPIAAVEVRVRDADWSLCVAEPDGMVVVPFGGNGWSVGEEDSSPLALSGGFVDAETLRLDLVALGTPHRAHLTLRMTPEASIGVLEASWETAPLSLPGTPGLGLAPLRPGPLPHA